jgi:hypothetical protein
MKKIVLANTLEILLDDDDFERLSGFHWFSIKHGRTHYATRKTCAHGSRKKDNRKTIRMHREILSPLPTEGIDHIDGNGLNNQKSNLRVATQRENSQNRHVIKKYSQYTGVCWSKQSKKWLSYITIKGKFRYLGLFKEEIDAAAMYRVTCAVLFPQSP